MYLEIETFNFFFASQESDFAICDPPKSQWSKKPQKMQFGGST